VLLGIIFPAYTFDIYRDAVMAPLEHEPHEVQAKDIGAICVEAVRLGQRMLLAGCVFQRAIDYPRAHPVFRGWQDGEDLVRKPPHQDPRMPICRAQQPAQMSLRARPGGPALPAL